MVETKEGYRYGGYTSLNWDSPDKAEFKKDENAFIFSFNTKKNMKVKMLKKVYNVINILDLILEKELLYVFLIIF